MMQVIETAIPAVKRVVPKRFGDERGWFSETYRADLLAQAGIDTASCRTTSPSRHRQGTVRGLHFQLAPAAQAKLVRVLAGTILDVVVDLRRSSPTFGQHVALRLDADGGEQLFVPAGFAHGFCTLEPDTMVAYKVDAYYSPAHDRSAAVERSGAGHRLAGHGRDRHPVGQGQAAPRRWPPCPTV